MKVYVSGPISGYPEQNESEFRRAESALLAAKYQPVVPHDILPWSHDGPCPRSWVSGSDEHTSACFLRTDLLVMLECDALFMLQGWEASVGARLEHTVAAHCGMQIYYDLARMSLSGPQSKA